MLVTSAVGRRQLALLSPPTLPRSTSITTTGLPFRVRLDPEGSMEVQRIA
jgi:hypothetical protein